jgi:hypothetical protein
MIDQTRTQTTPIRQTMRFVPEPVHLVRTPTDAPSRRTVADVADAASGVGAERLFRRIARRALAVLGAGLLVASCQDASTITYPTPPTQTSGPPASITVTTTNGIGASAGQVFLAARVYDASGNPVGGTTVQFATSAGSVQPVAVVTDGGGLAQATVTTSTPAAVTAVAGTAKTTTSVSPSL